MEFEHKVDAWTVGLLRNALSGLPDDMPILVDVAEEPGGDTVQERLSSTLASVSESMAGVSRSSEGNFGSAVNSHPEPICGVTDNARLIPAPDLAAARWS